MLKQISQRPTLNWIALAALTLASAAQAAPEVVTPNTGNPTTPSDWRFTPGQLFNGVAALDGVAKLSFQSNTESGTFRCSGSLLAGGAYILTAGHCGDDIKGTMTISFQVNNNVAAVTRTATAADVTLHPLWQGFDNSADAGTDLAIIKLNTPVTTIAGYQLSSTNDVGKTMLIAGFGATRAATTNTAPSFNDDRYGHYAYNVADVDSKTFNLTLNNYVSDWGATADYYTGTTYMFDFDSGTAANNALGRIAGVTGNAWTSDLGVTGEGITAGGDSGGGDFVWNGSQWLLSSVHSWGWQGNETAANGFSGACDFVGITDCSPFKNNDSSYGDLSGSTAVFDQAAWINSVIGAPVPEPETYALMLLGLGGLFGMKGFTSRRRRQAD